LDLKLDKQQIAWVQELEAAILAQLPGNTNIWFTRDMQSTDVEYFFDGSLKGDKLRGSVLRCSTFDTIDIQVFTESGEPADIELIEGDGSVLALVHVQGVSHRQGRLSIDWVVQQVLVKRKTSCRISLGDESDGIQSEVGDTDVQPKKQELLPAPITEVLETEMMPISDTDMELRSETELVSDELDIQAYEERARRRAALRIFMEANGLTPEDYDFPDTDEESDGEVVP
jgi:hypothetical protein